VTPEERATLKAINGLSDGPHTIREAVRSSLAGVVVTIVPERRDPGEGDEQYMVLEDNGDRLLIRPHGWMEDWGSLKPVQLVARTDVQVVEP